MYGTNFGNVKNPYRGFGAHTTENPIGTDTNPETTYGLTRKGQLRGFDSAAGPAVPASSGFAGFGDIITQAKDFLFSSTGLVLLLGALAIVGYKKGWFEGLESGD